jgi:hypothetical protein
MDSCWNAFLSVARNLLGEMASSEGSFRDLALFACNRSALSHEQQSKNTPVKDTDFDQIREEKQDGWGFVIGMVIGLNVKIRIKYISMTLQASQESVHNFNGQITSTALGIGA